MIFDQISRKNYYFKFQGKDILGRGKIRYKGFEVSIDVDGERIWLIVMSEGLRGINDGGGFGLVLVVCDFKIQFCYEYFFI